MKKKKLSILLLSACVALVAFTGCGKKDKKEDTPEPSTTEKVTEATSTDSDDAQEAPVTKEGYVINELTGEWIDDSLENQRPVAIMINNIINAIPQSGLSQADVTYEALVEGGITRLMCVFKDYSDIPKLGPVRSARHYYIWFADMLNAIYGHVGQSWRAKNWLEWTSLDDLDGLGAESSLTFYRDNTRKAPHNCYTDSEKLLKGIEYDKYSKEYTASKDNMFAFNTEDTPLASGNAANKVLTKFTSSYTPYFTYNSDDGQYYRYEFGDKHIDANTGEQLKYKNIICMLCAYTTYDDALRDIDIEVEGKGYYITDGEYIEITWHKDNGVMKYYNVDGTQLSMNPGKTFISIVDESVSDCVSFE